MPNWLEPDWLLGRRFVTDFRVIRIGAVQDPDGENRIVTIRLYGEDYVIALGELRTVIEHGLVVESPAP